MVPIVLVVFPSTVLLLRERSKAEESLILTRPKTLCVTVQFETLTVTNPVEPLSAWIPLPLLDATQFSTSNSAGAVLEEEQSKPVPVLPEAKLLRTVTFELSSARSPQERFLSRRTWSMAARAFPEAGCTSIPTSLPLKIESF